MRDNMMPAALLVYLLAMNGWLFVLMVIDKRRAAKRTRRVPERRLFGIAWLGGAAGGWAAMRWKRHKTKHRSFAIGLPAIALLQLAAAMIGLYWYYK